MAQKLQFCFTNISAKNFTACFRLQLLHEAPFLPHFRLMLLQFKFVKNYLCRNLLCISVKNVEIGPFTLLWNIFNVATTAYYDSKSIYNIGTWAGGGVFGRCLTINNLTF
jgi:hypothetical protein